MYHIDYGCTNGQEIMNLYEYQSKQLLVQYNLSIPTGIICSTVCEIETAILDLSLGPWIMKCQIHAGGRGKAGGIKIAHNQKDAISFARQWFGKNLITHQTDSSGQRVDKILVETITDISDELYLGAMVDCMTREIVCMVSTQGGVEIEKVAKKTPNLIHKIIIDPFMGPQYYQGRKLAYKLGLVGAQVEQFTNIFISLLRMLLEKDLMLVEINPLAISKNGNLVCVDAKISVDTNALFRHLNLSQMHDLNQEDTLEGHATKCNLNYVPLKGNIGCMVNGAGLAMATMDLIKYHGGSPANFLDVGGSATKERVTEAFKIILSDNSVKTVFVNIFGGIVRCDLIAIGIVSAVAEVCINMPVVVRLEGNNSSLGIQHLTKSRLNIIVTNTLTDAAKLVVALAEGN